MSNKRKIVLASKSPRRKRLLKQIGLEFEVRVSDYEEDMDMSMNPYRLAKHLALGKAKDVAKHYTDAIVIGADTFVVYDNKLIGKPKDKQEAKRILSNFSGKEHKVVTGFAVIDTKNNKIVDDCSVTKVRFRKLTEDEIDNYIKTGEPFDMAGAYGLMDRAAVLIEKVDGDFYVVIGLPLSKIYLVLKEMGVDALSN